MIEGYRARDENEDDCGSGNIIQLSLKPEPVPPRQEPRREF